MSGMIRSVEEIVDISESKNTPDRMAYKYVIKQVDKLVRTRAIDQQYDAMFEVPAMVLFQPHFDRSVVSNRIVRHYRKLGFKCTMEGFQIILRWGNAAEDSSESESEGESEQKGLYKDPKKEEDSSDDEKLPPPRKIHMDTGSSLTQRIASMKK